MAEKEQLVLKNSDLAEVLKKHFNVQGNYQIVVNFGVSGITGLNEQTKEKLPTAIVQVVNVGIEKVPVPDQSLSPAARSEINKIRLAL
jgi:hypothetical protein